MFLESRVFRESKVQLDNDVRLQEIGWKRLIKLLIK